MAHPQRVQPVILAIETSNPTADPGHSASVAVAQLEGPGAGNPRHLSSVTLGPDESQGLLPSIDRCFRGCSLTPHALRAPGSRIVVSIGPGGYTSIRLAVTAAKILAESTGARCIPVPTAHVAAARVSNPRPFAVALASKRETAWVAAFNPDRTEHRVIGISDERVIETLVSIGVDLLVVDRFAPPAMVERARACGVRIQPPTFDAMACCDLGARYQPLDPIELEPLYPREPEAVTKWRVLHAAAKGPPPQPG
ncbi:MAG: hypothetical protein KF838_00225 [Phycisphaeraceae bacterium]|nr:MAG: hypothetical protein KF838_00225 [Phycisphaeraceae bacterium]